MELTLLFGAISTILLQLFKMLVKKFGYEITKAGILIGSFLLAVAYAVLIKENLLSKEMITWIVGVMAVAESTYTLIVKFLANSLFSTGDTTSSTPISGTEGQG